jgi:hypothetical protein
MTSSTFSSYFLAWISMPDYVKRLERGLPVNAPIDYQHLYGKGNSATREEQIKGYNDYPVVTEVAA